MVRLPKLRLPEKNFWRNRWVLSFMGGLFFGLVYAIAFGRDYLENVGFASDVFQIRYLEEEIDKNILFPYLLKGRGFSYFIVWIIGSSFLGAFMLYAVLGWVGFSVGVYVVAAAVKYGLGGIFFFLATLFPQGLFYIPAFGLVLWYSYKNYGRKDVFLYFVVFVIGLLLLFMGILTESYVNPQIIKNMLKVF